MGHAEYGAASGSRHPSAMRRGRRLWTGDQGFARTVLQATGCDALGNRNALNKNKMPPQYGEIWLPEATTQTYIPPNRPACRL